jgi:hypothetical protein
MNLREIKCDKKGCKKIIGHKDKITRPVYYDGTCQIGYKSFCSDKHLEEYRKLLTSNL